MTTKKDDFITYLEKKGSNMTERSMQGIRLNVLSILVRGFYETEKKEGDEITALRTRVKILECTNDIMSAIETCSWRKRKQEIDDYNSNVVGYMFLTGILVCIIVSLVFVIRSI